MSLPIPHPLPPMEACSVPRCPPATTGNTSRSGTASAASPFATATRSSCNRKSGQPLARYFPEIVDALRRLDGEALRARRRDRRPGRRRRCRSTSCCSGSIRPRAACASSRPRHPADLHRRSICSSTTRQVARRTAARRAPRRARSVRDAVLPRQADRVRLSPATRDLEDARRWFAHVGGDLDGIIAKRLDCRIEPATQRHAEDQGPAHRRLRRRRLPLCVESAASSARCCSASTTTTACSTTSASPPASQPREQAARSPQKLEALIEPPGFTGRAPGGPSRWSTERTGEWQPLAPEARRRSAVRPLHRRPLPPRHAAPPLASRQSAGAVHDGSGGARYPLTAGSSLVNAKGKKNARTTHRRVSPDFMLHWLPVRNNGVELIPHSSAFGRHTVSSFCALLDWNRDEISGQTRFRGLRCFTGILAARASD